MSSKVHNDNEITYFAKTNFRNQEKKFGIRLDDRRRHMYVVGKTGVGKTEILKNMIIQDMENGHGLAYIDPNGDAVEDILECVPSHRINDVIYYNPADTDYPIAFNILENVDPEYKHLVADGLMGVFTKIWANMWSARMEYILRNCILALLDVPGNTLLGVMRLLVDKDFRGKVIDKIKDPVVKSFWVEEYANYNDRFRTEAIAPIQNKIGQFLSSSIIRNIVGQTKSTIDLRKIMDDGKILLMNLSKGKIGEDNSALLGAMMVTKIQLAAMSRADTPEKERKDFFLYVDEFQNFATESFADILSESRKYHLGLIVGHQYIAQLATPDSTRVRDAVFGNVGTIVCFRVGAADAYFLLKENLNPQQYIAFIFLIIGSFLVSLDFQRHGAWHWLKKKLHLEKRFSMPHIRKALWVALPSAALFGISHVLAKYVYTQTEFLTGFIWTRFGSLLAVIFLLLIPLNRELIFKDLKKNKKKKKQAKKTGVKFLFGQACGGSAMLLIQYAIFLGSVSLVTSLQGVQYAFVFLIILITTLFFPKFLKEEITKEIFIQKIIAVIFIFIGLYFIAS